MELLPDPPPCFLFGGNNTVTAIAINEVEPPFREEEAESVNT